MKIVIISHAFPPYIGGLSYVVENLSVNLAKMGFEVEVLTLNTDGSLPGYEEYMGVYVRRFKGYAPDNCYFIPSMEFVEHLKRVEADVVHIHNIGSVLTPVAITVVNRSRRSKGKPRIVVSPHHHESGSKWHTKIAWFFYKPIARYSLSNVDVLHAVSEYEAFLIKKDFGKEAVIIPNGVSEDVFKYRWRPLKDRIVLAYAGRVERYKRVDLVIRVAKELSKFDVDVVVRIIGDGSDLQRIIGIAKNARVRLEVLGFLPRERYLEMLSRSTVLINLSDYEAYSIVAAEALAMGVPAIVAKPWGMTFKGITGAHIINKYDICKIADVIVKIYSGILEYDSEVNGDGRILPWSYVVKQMVQKLYLR